MTPAILYQAALRTNPAPANKPQRKYPLPQQSPIQFAAYAFDQQFEQLLSSFPPAPKNTPSNAGPFPLGDANAILTGFSQPATSGAGMGKYTATFHIVPASWDDYSELDFTFPGFPGLLGTADARDPFCDVVPVRMRYDYFVVDPDNVLNGLAIKDSGGAAINIVASRSLIPILPKSFFFLIGNPTLRYNSITPAGGITVGSNVYGETVPNLATYKSFIANALANNWTSDIWNGVDNSQAAMAGQFVAADSKTDDYAGNIIQRVTRYVLFR